MNRTFFIFLFYLTPLFVLQDCNNSNKKNFENEKKDEIYKETLEYYTKSNDQNTPKALKLKYAKKAMNNSKKIKNELKRRNIQSKISLIYYYTKEYDLFLKSNKDILNLSKKNNDSIGIAKTLRNFGHYYKRVNKLDSAFSNFQNSIEIYEFLIKSNKLNKESEIEGYASLLYNTALIQKTFKDNIGSESNIIKAINQFEKLEDIDVLLSLYLSYSNLGIISKDLKKYEEALENYQTALKYAKKMKQNSKWREVQALNNIGVVYKEKGDYSLAIDKYEEALGYTNILNNRISSKATLIDNLAYVKLLSGQTDNILSSFLEAKKIRDSLDDKSDLVTSNLHISEYFKAIKNDSISKLYGKKALDIATKSKLKKLTLKSLLLLIKNFPKDHRSIDYANKYIHLNDSIQNQERISSDKFARVKFKTAKKEQQIEEVQNQNTIYLLGMLLLVTFIAFIIYFSRQRTRYLAQQNKIVEFQAAYETETRISKRLHDELGNDIFQVMMQYQNDPHDPQITKKLNTAYNKARDISRENSEFEVDETYTEELTDMLTNYTENHSKLILRGIDKINWDTVDKNLKITIYRVLQELMTNMQKHSQADLVAIVFKNEKNKLLIKYSDNGIGIEQEDIKSKNGLRNTEKRVQAIQGNITFDSAKDKGFKAEIKIPV